MIMIIIIIIIIEIITSILLSDPKLALSTGVA